MNVNKVLWYAIGTMLVLVAGCTTYYKVTDPAGNRFYYTTDIDTTDNGAIRIRDERTGANVTLQSSEVLEISKRNTKQRSKGSRQKNDSIVFPGMTTPTTDRGIG